MVHSGAAWHTPSEVNQWITSISLPGWYWCGCRGGFWYSQVTNMPHHSDPLCIGNNPMQYGTKNWVPRTPATQWCLHSPRRWKHWQEECLDFRIWRHLSHTTTVTGNHSNLTDKTTRLANYNTFTEVCHSKSGFLGFWNFKYNGMKVYRSLSVENSKPSSLQTEPRFSLLISFQSAWTLHLSVMHFWTCFYFRLHASSHCINSSSGNLIAPQHQILRCILAVSPLILRNWNHLSHIPL